MAEKNQSLPRGVARLLGFLLLLGLGLYGVDAMLTLGLRRLETSFFGVSNRVVTGRVNAEIVISGSSRALSHYDSKIIQEVTGHTAFNIGRNGSQTDMQLAFLKAYLKHNSKPKLVVHNLDLFSFLTSHEIYDPVQYVPYIREDSIYAGIKRTYPDAWKWKYLPLYGYVVEDMRFNWLGGLRGLVGKQPKEDHFQGYLPRYQEWTGDFEKFRQSIPNGIETKVEPQGLRDLAELVELCRAENIPVLLVYSPEYAEMQKLESNRREIFAHFQTISDRFNVPIWDYSDSPLCVERDNFYNSQHLNAKGATAFSQDFAQRLVRADWPPARP